MSDFSPPPGKYRVVTWTLASPRVRAVVDDFDDPDTAIAEARRIFAEGPHDASVFRDNGRSIFVAAVDGPPADFARMGSATTAAYKRR